MKFRLGSIPVDVHPVFLFLVGLIGVISSPTSSTILPLCIIAFCSVLFHEYGHAATARYFGQKVHIQLFALGGLTHRKGPRIQLWKEFLVVLAGPAVGALLVLFFSLLFYKSNGIDTENLSPTSYVFAIGAALNLIWTCINLLPIHPLDGGQLVRIVFEAVFGVKGIRYSLILSMAISSCLALFFFLRMNVILGVVLSLLSFEGWRTWASCQDLTEADQNTALQALYKQGVHAFENGEMDVAKSIFLAMLAKLQSGILHSGAVEILGIIAGTRGDLEDAFQRLSSVKSTLSQKGQEMYVQVALTLGHYKEAIEVGSKLFQLDPNGESASLIAKCHAQLGEVAASVGWLERAVEEGGIADLEGLFAEKEFDPIRHLPEFERVRLQSTA